MFITFEGPEGSGKTTQIMLLYAALEARGLTVVRTREPGGTPIGEQVRTVLHDLRNAGMLPATEILLYSASRAQHVGELIRPALQRGAIVISDRFAESTMAYQGYGRELDLDALRQITAFATGGLQPDLVVYLDLDVATGLARKRRDQLAGLGEWNRMDQQTLEFHERVHKGYLTMAAESPERWLTVDASRSVDAIHATVLARVEALLTSSTVGAQHAPECAQ
ncbi:MAG: dTMP kinase [Chloroflexi bacterium]|nr:dTMP kinase [Chloroflexota bacterium]